VLVPAGYCRRVNGVIDSDCDVVRWHLSVVTVHLQRCTVVRTIVVLITCVVERP